MMFAQSVATIGCLRSRNCETLKYEAFSSGISPTKETNDPLNARFSCAFCYSEEGAVCLRGWFVLHAKMQRERRGRNVPTNDHPFALELSHERDIKKRVTHDRG